MLLVARADDGTFETLAMPADAYADFGRVAAALLGRPEDAAGSTASGADGSTASGADGSADAVTGASAWSLADAVPPGSTAAVALIEHVWAGPLKAAIERAGGTPLDETWLAPDDLAALDALRSTGASDERRV